MTTNETNTTEPTTFDEIRAKAIRELEDADAAFFVIVSDATDDGAAVATGAIVDDDLPDEQKVNLAVMLAKNAMEQADDLQKRAMLAGIMAELGGSLPRTPAYGDDSTGEADPSLGSVAAGADDPAYY